jgi:hypothetical protein
VQVPEIDARDVRGGALLRAKTPAGEYVLRGPDLRQRCVEDVCSSTVQRSARLELLDKGGQLVWQTPVDGDLSEDAAVVVADDRGAYVVLFSPVAMCARVRNFAAADGRPEWDVTVGCMTEAHVSYSNDVQLVLRADRLEVWGKESAGRYVVALDLRTGTSLCSRRFDP